MPRCRRCQRLNPPGAAYCYFDGTSIDGSPAGDEPFLSPWTFAGRNPCRNVDEFIRESLANWNEAKSALQRGNFADFFRSIRREDLASLASKPIPDADLALQTFLERLPSKSSVKPAIDVVPRRVHFADLRKGLPRSLSVKFLNRGAGLLNGRIAVMENVSWLKPGTLRLSATVDQSIELTVDPNQLPGAGSFFARLKIESNGGSLEIPVQADMHLAGIKFKEFEISDAYDLAKVMLAHPKRAARWLADGEVEELFSRHGWEFPIQGLLAPSLGAVQQYFESLKLSSIPPITFDSEMIDLTAVFPERISSQISLKTPLKKWIHATASSNEMWLKPLASIVAGGREVEVPFEADSGLLKPGFVHEGILRIQVNGGIEHSFLVRLDVRKPFEPWTRKIFRPFTG